MDDRYCYAMLTITWCVLCAISSTLIGGDHQNPKKSDRKDIGRRKMTVCDEESGIDSCTNVEFLPSLYLDYVCRKPEGNLCQDQGNPMNNENTHNFQQTRFKHVRIQTETKNAQSLQTKHPISKQNNGSTRKLKGTKKQRKKKKKKKQKKGKHKKNSR